MRPERENPDSSLDKRNRSHAGKVTSVIETRRVEAIALKAPIIIPIELGLANPQMANVAIDALLAWKETNIYN